MGGFCPFIQPWTQANGKVLELCPSPLVTAEEQRQTMWKKSVGKWPISPSLLYKVMFPQGHLKFQSTLMLYR